MKPRLFSRLAGFCSVLCLLTFSQTVFAQATLSIQGIIRKSSGAAVDDGKYDLTFKLYPTQNGGTAVHSETQSVGVVGGIYSTELGGGATPLAAAFDQTYYLGVSVDGGTELIPRVRLTSSPYALSLLGTTNLFPSSGAIGAGTIAPTAGYQMHIKNASAEGKLLVEGSTAGLIDFKKGSNIGRVGFGTANDEFVVNPGANNTALQYNGTTKLTVTTNGVDVPGTLSAGTLNATNFSPANLAVTSKLAIGQASVDANNALKVVGNTYLQGFVEINGSKNAGYGDAYLLWNSPNGISIGEGLNYLYSMKVSHAISAPRFVSNSDRRIKKDLRLSDKNEDLSLLQKLRVTDYRHVDEVGQGMAFRKGFIAQEVEQIFPEAVSQSENFIPDVYALSTRTKLAVGQLTISLEKNHGLAVDDEVKLMLESGEKRVIVAAVPSENTFSTAWDETSAPEKIFVYGKKVKDFRAVDYDRIFTLNVSATQELAQKVELLEKENAALKSENGTMKASAEKFDARLRALENRISN